MTPTLTILNITFSLLDLHLVSLAARALIVTFIEMFKKLSAKVRESDGLVTVERSDYWKCDL